MPYRASKNRDIFHLRFRKLSGIPNHHKTRENKAINSDSKEGQIIMKIGRALRALTQPGLKGHFGQYAEDAIIRKYFPHNTTKGTYLDVGAYHPFKFSNTAFFWLKGWNGVNVDANKASIDLFKKHRPNDKNIWAAIVPDKEIKAGKTTVSLMLPDGSTTQDLSSVGTVQADSFEDLNFQSAYSVPAKSIRQIMVENELTQLDYLNIDVEGNDESTIKDIDFDFCTPKTISVEDFSQTFEELIESPTTKHLIAHDYKLMSRAAYTSIFSFRGMTY
jgi:hypothetical protein